MGSPGTGGLLERETMVAEVDELVRAAQRGSGRVLLVEGAPGIGKTALLQQVAARALAADLTVLRASGAELESELAYGVVRQLFSPLAAAGGASWDGAAELARPVVDPAAPAGATIDQFGAMHGLFWLCSSLAQEAPLALTVDDIHWADPTSLRWLAYLARRVAELPVLVALARRPLPETGTPDALAGLDQLPGAVTRTVAPLSEAASAALVRRAVGPDVPDEVCRSCHTATGGNPFYLNEVVSAGGETLMSAGGGPSGLLAPEGVMRSVVARLGPLGSEAMALARAVAILGSRVELRHAASLAEFDPRDADSIADRLAAASILLPSRPLEFVHPIVRAAVYGELPDGARSTLHHRAARVLHDDGMDPPAVAVQLMVAESYGDPWVVTRLRNAAQTALGRGDSVAAGAYLTRALREPPDPAHRGELLFELGTVERQLMAAEAGEHLSAALSLSRDPRRRAQIAVELMAMLIQPERLREGMEVIEQVLPAAIDEAPDVAAELEANRVGLPTFQLAPEQPDSTASYRLLERLDPLDLPARLLSGVLATEAMARGRPATEVWKLLETALIDSRTRVAEAADRPVFLVATITANLCERFDLSERAYVDALVEARRRGSAFAIGAIWTCRSQLYFRLGRVRSAEADARQAIDAFGSFGVPSPPAMLIDALMERGEIDEALEALERTGYADEPPPSLFSILFLTRRIRLRVAAGQVDGALADLALAERWTIWAGLGRAVTLPWRVEGALACLAAGDPERARSLADENLRLALAFGASGALGVALRTAAIAHGGERGRELLGESVATLATSRMRLEHAKSLAALGAAQRRAGERTQARVTLTEALDLADDCGSLAVAEQARAELVIAGARPRRNRSRGPDALTATELRTATLAAQGMTNTEIAQTFFVTAKTVERHLTNCYAKLGIASRRELADALGGAADDPPERVPAGTASR